MYQRSNQNPYIEEEQTTQWPNEKVQTTIYKHTYKTKDRLTRTSLKTRGELAYAVSLHNNYYRSNCIYILRLIYHYIAIRIKYDHLKRKLWHTLYSRCWIGYCERWKRFCTRLWTSWHREPDKCHRIYNILLGLSYKVYDCHVASSSNVYRRAW